jgi:glycoside/pentoside/hexuronide:cation symporter, GPH family
MTSFTTMIRASLVGIPLAFVGLPLYLHVPHVYATVYGVDVAWLGAILLLVRMIDAVQDPWIGAWLDRTSRSLSSIMIGAGCVLVPSFVGLFSVPAWAQSWMMGWMTIMMLLVCTSFSVMMIALYAAGILIAPDRTQQTQLSSVREGCLMIGVVLAASLPSILAESVGDQLGYQYFSWIFIPIALLGIGITARVLRAIVRPSQSATEQGSWRILMQDAPIRRILILFCINSLPTSITSVLFLFYVEDVLGAKSDAGFMLLAYFAAAALSLPLWSRASQRFGLIRCLSVGMMLAVLSFIWAYGLGRGDAHAFYLICLSSGIAVGADLCLMPALYSGALHAYPHMKNLAFSLWHFLSKSMMALAAGVVLPLLAWYDYHPAASTHEGITPLIIAYTLIPCSIKLVAMALCWRMPQRGAV